MKSAERPGSDKDHHLKGTSPSRAVQASVDMFFTIPHQEIFEECPQENLYSLSSKKFFAHETKF